MPKKTMDTGLNKFSFLDYDTVLLYGKYTRCGQSLQQFLSNKATLFSEKLQLHREVACSERENKYNQSSSSKYEGGWFLMRVAKRRPVLLYIIKLNTTSNLNLLFNTEESKRIKMVKIILKGYYCMYCSERPPVIKDCNLDAHTHLVKLSCDGMILPAVRLFPSKAKNGRITV